MKNKATTILLALLIFTGLVNAQDIVIPLNISKGIDVNVDTPIDRGAFAGTFNATLNGNPINLYCIDLTHDLQWNTTYNNDGATSSYITYILNNYYPYVTDRTDALFDVKREAAAVQMALWHFSDNATYGGPNDVKERADEIILDANDNHGNVHPVKTLSISPVTLELPQGADAAFVVEAYDETNSPAPNVEITLVANDGTLSETTVTTDENGVSPTIYLTQGSLDESLVNATAQVIIPQGTRYVRQGYPDEYQKLVLATPSFATRSVQASVRWFNEVDLSIVKTADNSEPNNGDVVNYTITLTNNSAPIATDIKVTDLLPEGLVFLSSFASDGSYNLSTSTWTVDELAGNSSATLEISVTVDYEIMYEAALNLGPVADFNVFVLYDVNQPSSDTEGKMAVGRNATLANYSVGDKLTTTGEDVLVVGRKITYTSGRVYNGNVVYGQFQDMHPTMVSVDEGTIRQESIINFADAQAYLVGLSNTLKEYTVNGTTTFEWGGLKLVGNDPYINVFEVDGNELSQANNFEINAPNGSVVIVNISRANVSWTGGASVIGTSKENVIYNFHRANSISIQGIEVLGTILAPKASVDFVSGVQYGQMICKNLTGQGQFNTANFVGNIPVEAYITNVAEIISVANPEINPDNDISSATIHVNFGDGNGNGSGDDDTNWELVGNFDAAEIVWSMTTDNAGNTYIGTVGGNIYKIDINNEKTLVNEGMNVGWIWSLYFNENNGRLFAGTEQGMFRIEKDFSGWDHMMTGKDVRSVLKTGAKELYSGTWGFGVFKYNFDGENAGEWTAINDGLDILAVHSLTSDSDGNLYAGTMGGGVYKYENNAWTKLDVGYDFIWSLATVYGEPGVSEDKFVAATYGGGVYVSYNRGATWNKLNGGLEAAFVYAVSVDQNDNVYVSTWAGGVYKLDLSGSSDSPNSENWVPVGMGGYGVSTMMFNNADGIMYAGTRDGQLFKKDNSLTGVNEDAEIPTEFNLAQNYPNPFNPTTKIEFSIPQAGEYSLRVYNILGQEVRTLISGDFQPGKYRVDFDAQDLASGVYIYRFAGQNIVFTKKMLLIK